MIDDSPEHFEPHVATAQMLMPIYMRPESRFGIVHVHHAHAFQADHAVDFLNRVFESRFIPQFVTCGKQVRRIQTYAQAFAQSHFRAGVQNSADLFQARADRASLSRGDLDQDAQVAEIEISGCFPNRSGNLTDGLVHRAVEPAAGMHHEIFRAQHDCPAEFAPKSADGFGPDFHVWRGQIDQVIRMDDQWMDAQFTPPLAKLRCVLCPDRLLSIGPHSRAGGKNLHGGAS